jgi:hypothetical protein
MMQKHYKRKKCRRWLSSGRREMIRSLLERNGRPETHSRKRARDEPFLTDVTAYLAERLRQDLEFRNTVEFGRLTVVKGPK